MMLLNKLKNWSQFSAGIFSQNKTWCCLSSFYSTMVQEHISSKNHKSFPKQSDIVIIGGGSIGCNIMYHLAKMGMGNNVVLIEKNKLTSGTTWHSAGLVWRLRPNDMEIQLISYTYDLLNRLEEETGISPGWTNNGGLFIANNKVRLDEYIRLATTGKAFGIEGHILDRSETKKLYPLMNVDDIHGSLYSPYDGTLDPNGFCLALSRFATRSGAQVLEGVTVKDIATREYTMGSRKVTEVITNQGSIKTDAVINCSGAWANDISHLVGIHTPLVAMKHAYVTTETISGVKNMPNVRDHDASIYIKLQGDSLHIGGYENNPIFIDKLDSNFAFGLFELDWDVFGVHIEGAINRIPVVGETGIKSTVCGPESFTPDHKPIMGEDPRVRGFYHAVGFNSAGMMLGGGCGAQMAKWIVQGRPDIDMYGYDVRRFDPKVSSDLEWIRQKSHESYMKNYSIVFPHDEPLAARNMKQDPFHKLLLQFGCVFQERLGWERPGWFGDESVASVQPYDWYGAYPNIMKINTDNKYRDMLNMDYSFDYQANHKNIQRESLSVRFRAGLFNMSYFGKFFLTGPDAQAAVDWIFTNKIDGCNIGSTIYTCMLNKRAGIEADLTVSVVSGQDDAENGPADPIFKGVGFYIAAAGGAAYHNLAHIQTVIQDAGFNVELKDCSQDMGMLSLQGPLSRQILQKLTLTDLSNENFPLSTHKMIEVAGHRVRALRVSFVGELGWELHIPIASCVAIYNALKLIGTPLGMKDAGYRAMDSLSLEKGYPLWHQEIRINDTPLEANLLFTCRLKNKEDDFNGRKALETQRLQGATKKKVCLTLDHDKNVCLLGLETIYRDGIVVGYVRRGDYAFYLDRPMAYGYVSRPDGTKITQAWLSSGSYELESMGKLYSATFHKKTPFDPENKKLSGNYDDNIDSRTSHLLSLIS